MAVPLIAGVRAPIQPRVLGSLELPPLSPTDRFLLLVVGFAPWRLACKAALFNT